MRRRFTQSPGDEAGDGRGRGLPERETERGSQGQAEVWLRLSWSRGRGGEPHDSTPHGRDGAFIISVT